MPIHRSQIGRFSFNLNLQYFLWYLIFLPFYLPTSSLLRNSTKGIAALILWILGQVRIFAHVCFARYTTNAF